MLVIAMIFPITNPASAAVTWSTSSPNDSFNRPDLNSQYDLTYVSATIFDNEVDSIYFYLNFKNVAINMGETGSHLTFFNVHISADHFESILNDHLINLWEENECLVKNVFQFILEYQINMLTTLSE